MKESILITGANGFIGKYITSALSGERYDIIGIGRSSENSSADYAFFQADITDYEKIEEVFCNNKIDHVVHLAGLVHKKGKNLSESEYHRTNVEATGKLFELSKKYKVKSFVFSSSIEVYGDSDISIFTENSTCNPITLYGKSKLLAEKKIINSIGSTPINYYCLRFAPVYASDFKLNLNKRFYLKKKIAYRFKTGDYSFHFCAIGNIVDSVLSILKKLPESGIYNLGDTESINANSFLELERSYGSAKFVVRMPYYLCYFAISVIEKILKLFGKTESTISIYNFRKLFKSAFYPSEKLQAITCAFRWNVANTLYQNDSEKSI